MALYATNRFPGDGTTTSYEFNFVGKYIARTHVKVYQEDNATKVRTYVSINDSNFLNDTTLRSLPVTPVGSTLVIYRDTPKPPLVDFVNGSRFTEYNMDLVARQGLFVAMEALDAGDSDARQQLLDAIAVVVGLVDDATAAVSDATAAALAAATSAANAATSESQAQAAKVAAEAAKVAAQTAKTDAQTAASASAGSASASAGSATAAAGSASAASTSASNAAGSATTASNMAGVASGYATTAGTHATNASTSATNAGNSATAAASSASAASTSAGNAATSATNAANSATAAANSATAASQTWAGPGMLPPLWVATCQMPSRTSRPSTGGRAARQKAVSFSPIGTPAGRVAVVSILVSLAGSATGVATGLLWVASSVVCSTPYSLVIVIALMGLSWARRHSRSSRE